MAVTKEMVGELADLGRIVTHGLENEAVLGAINDSVLKIIPLGQPDVRLRAYTAILSANVSGMAAALLRHGRGEIPADERAAYVDIADALAKAAEIMREATGDGAQTKH